MAYSRNCVHCGQLIVMSELSPGRWQPWEPDGSGRHQCGSGQDKSASPSLSLDTLVANAKTYLTRCPWCSLRVHYHTNGYGDCVYFDSLGYPWQIHACWEKHWKEKKDRQRVLSQFSNQKTVYQQKLQILAGVLHSVQRIVASKYTLYLIHETTLAQRLDISLNKLKKDYGHLYQAEARGLRLFEGSLTTQTTDIVSTPLHSKLVNCKLCNDVIWESRLHEHLSKAHPSPGKICPCCRKTISKQFLPQHLAICQKRKQTKKSKKNKTASSKVLKGNTSISSVSREIRPLLSRVRCSYCSEVINESLLNKHIQLYHAARTQVASTSKRQRLLATCPYCFKTVNNYKKHVRKNHQDKL